ncbi:MAG TPA: pitrilysin family protein [Stellaceae bacterium]|nr:pitrilysin family protein [Stellaceae bacterium]
MSVTVTTLPNGLRVMSDPLESVETVSLGLWVNIGTRNEPASVNGVAHFLEHMAFKGTKRRSALDIAAEIEAVGGHLNAYTSREQTAYYAKVLKEDMGLAIDLLADILQHSVFDAAEIERERTVILQEIGQTNDTPDDLIFDLFQEQAFPDQPMGRPVLGRAEIIRALTRDQVAGYLERHYAASGMVLSAAGNFRHETLVALAERAFRDLPASAAVLHEPARYQGGETRVPRDLEQVHIVLGFAGFGHADPDYYAAMVLSTALGGGMSSRLFQEIRERRGLVYSIHSFIHAFSDGGLFGVYAGTGEEEIAELMPVLCEELRRLDAGIAGDELQRARAQLKAGLMMSLESTSARAEQQASHMLIHGTPLMPQEMMARIDAVDGEQLLRVARRLRQVPPTLTALGPIAHLAPFADHCAALGR